MLQAVAVGFVLPCGITGEPNELPLYQINAFQITAAAAVGVHLLWRDNNTTFGRLSGNGGCCCGDWFTVKVPFQNLSYRSEVNGRGLLKFGIKEEEGGRGPVGTVGREGTGVGWGYVRTS